MKKLHDGTTFRSGELGAGRGRVARRRSWLWGWRVNAWANQQKQIDEKDGYEDKAADKDVRPESHHSFVFGKVRGRDVFVLVVAFVIVFGHAHSLLRRCSGWR